MKLYALGVITFVFLIAFGQAMCFAEEHNHNKPKPKPPVVKPPRIFFDKAPAIVKYQLKRLSDEELQLVVRKTTDPKYIPVYEEILRRESMPALPRIDALKGLGKLRNQDLLEAILAIGREIEVSSDPLVPLLASEIQLLPTLKAKSNMLKAVVKEEQGVIRQLAIVGLLAADLPLGDWLQTDESSMHDLMLVIPLIADVTQADSLRRRAIATLDATDSELVSAALRALAALEIEPADSFARAARAMANPATTAAAIELMLTLPTDAIEANTASDTIGILVERIESTPVDQRTEPAAQQLVEATDKLLPVLGTELSQPIRQKLMDITVRVVRIETVYEEMRYDTPYFVVQKGRKIRLELANPDAMPHNWNLCEPDSMREVAKLAAALSGRLDANGRQYVPDDERVLVASPAAQAGATVTVDFEAPTEPGEYPYVCTYPGHWMRMYGVLLVVDDIDAYKANPEPPEDPLGSNRTFVQKWKVEDFSGDLTAAINASTPEIGKKLFAEATCAACHKVDCEGGALGPDLTKAFTRWKHDTKGIVREIIEPSHKIDKKYEQKTVFTMNGQVINGIVVKESDEGVEIVTNPDVPKPTKIAANNIDEIEVSDVSAMPKSLLDRFTRDEVIEILGYLKHTDDNAKEDPELAK